MRNIKILRPTGSSLVVSFCLCAAVAALTLISTQSISASDSVAGTIRLLDDQHLHPGVTFKIGSLASVLGIMLLGVAYWNYALRCVVRNRTASLQQELEERHQIEVNLKNLTDKLELRVRERTVELENEIRDRIVAEQAAKSSERKFKTLFQNAADPIYIADMEGRMIAANDQASRELGYSQDELLLLRVSDIDALDQPDHGAKFFQMVCEYGKASFETIHKRKDGSNFIAEVNARLIDYDGQPAILGIARNLTERKEAEAEKDNLMAQLSQSQKIESIGRLAGGIAHDFNNLLTPIIGYSELLMHDIPPGNRGMEKVERIRQASDKAKILIQQLLSFGRKQILEMKTIDLNQVVSSFYEILRRTIRENIDIRLNMTQDSYGIHADKNQIEQIIMNLAVNAQDAIENKGTITIETAPVVLDEEYVRQHAGVKPGRFLMLAVSDTGCGMDKETLKKIYEPFFTTKITGEGTGLGLSTVYGLVKQHEGSIWVYSEPGKGSAFKIYFPIVDAEPVDELQPALEHVVMKSVNHTVLLVEDSEMVRDMVHELLRDLGFDMIVAEGPKQALKMIGQKQIDLLVTDVVMPDMTGPELHNKLLKSQPGMKTLYMSGYTNNVVIHHGVLDEGTNFIQKPFAVNDLAIKVKNILDPVKNNM